MPNHCSNKLGIAGLKEDVEQFIEFVTNKGEDKDEDPYELFSNLIPMPKELEQVARSFESRDEDLIEKYGSDNWYDWCNANWGTKWGDYSISSAGVNYETKMEYPHKDNDLLDYDNGVSVLTGDASIHFEYHTAWAPGCDELSNAIIDKFPTLRGFISYEEQGMGFAGQLIFANGEIISHDQWEFHQSYNDVNDIDFSYLGA